MKFDYRICVYRNWLKVFSILAFIFLTLASNVHSNSDTWIMVYDDTEVKIEIQDNVEIIGQHIGRFTFLWIWTEPRALKMTPGVYYQSRMEKTDINFKTQQYKTTESVKLFDQAGKEIQFDLVVPSKKWDQIKQGSIMDKVYEAALDIFRKYKNS